ncbi:MAG: YigZ family protein [bacterium]
MAEPLVPAGYGEIEYVEKRSRFIGRVWPAETEAEALAHIRAMREQHWDATHNVYAYSIRQGGYTRFSDDGEPSGTSGMPVLNVFRAREVGDFVCVVTRYFGGILLGAGGLVRAYSKSASLALEAAGVARLMALTTLSVICTYAHYERILAELPKFSAEAVETAFGADVELSLTVPPAHLAALTARLTELTAALALIEVTGETVRAVKV